MTKEQKKDSLNYAKTAVRTATSKTFAMKQVCHEKKHFIKFPNGAHQNAVKNVST